MNAELVPDDSTTVVFTDNDTDVTVTIPASAFDYQQSIDWEGNNYAADEVQLLYYLLYKLCANIFYQIDTYGILIYVSGERLTINDQQLQ